MLNCLAAAPLLRWGSGAGAQELGLRSAWGSGDFEGGTEPHLDWRMTAVRCGKERGEEAEKGDDTLYPAGLAIFRPKHRFPTWQKPGDDTPYPARLVSSGLRAA